MEIAVIVNSTRNVGTKNVCNLFVMKRRKRRNLLFMRILRAEKHSSPATSSIKRVEKALIKSMFSLFFCLLGVRVETCKMFTLFYTRLE